MKKYVSMDDSKSPLWALHNELKNAQNHAWVNEKLDLEKHPLVWKNKGKSQMGFVAN